MGHPERTVSYSTPECAPQHFHALLLASFPLRVISSQRTGVDLNSYADLAVRLVNSANQGCGDGLATVESYRALVADRQHLAGRATVSGFLRRTVLNGTSRISPFWAWER